MAPVGDREHDRHDRRYPMRILIAVDGSPSSDRAVDLLSTFDLPPDSRIRVVAD